MQIAFKVILKLVLEDIFRGLQKKISGSQNSLRAKKKPLKMLRALVRTRKYRKSHSALQEQSGPHSEKPSSKNSVFHLILRALEARSQTPKSLGKLFLESPFSPLRP